jgi:hypothetical protein
MSRDPPVAGRKALKSMHEPVMTCVPKKSVDKELLAGDPPRRTRQFFALRPSPNPPIRARSAGRGLTVSPRIECPSQQSVTVLEFAQCLDLLTPAERSACWAFALPNYV